MPLDSLCVRGLAEELAQSLAGARIDKIHMPARDSVLIHLRGQQGAVRLLICGGSGARVHLTASKLENPDSPPMLCMLLRKHIGNGRVLGVYQPAGERIIEIIISSAGEMGDIAEKRLICEMTGRMTNIMLVDERGVIIACLKTVDQEASPRPVLPGLIYRLPPAQEKPQLLAMSGNEIAALCREIPEGREIDFLMERIGGLPPLIMREIVFRSRGGQDELCRLLTEIRDMAPRPFMLVRDGKYFDFAPCDIRQYPDAQAVEWDGFSALLDDFYREKTRDGQVKTASADIQRTMQNAKKRLERKLADQRQELLAAQNRQELKNKAELITANLHAIRQGDKKAVVTDYFSDDLSSVEITLDPLLSPQQNAQRLFKKYARQKNAEEALTAQIEKGEAELEYISNVLYSISTVNAPSEIAEIRAELLESGYLRSREKQKRKPPKAAFSPRSFQVDGFTILCGRNNNENDALTHRHAQKNDMWLHARNIPGAHVIIEAGGKEIPQQVIEAGAKIAAFYSSGSGRVAVDYTLARHVKKPQGARPGMVNYFQFKTAIVEGALPNGGMDI